MRDSRVFQAGIVSAGPRGNALVTATSTVKRTEAERGMMTHAAQAAGGAARHSSLTTSAAPGGVLRCKVPASTQCSAPAARKHNCLAAPVSGTRTLLPQTGEEHPVVVFLRSHGLGQYAEHIVRNGFDDLDTLLDIGDSDIQDLGIPSLHAMKLLDVTRTARDRGCGPGTLSVPALDDANPVAVFLKDVGLSQYAEPLLRSGFDEMETLLDIGDADMKDLGIPRGHALKLRKKLQNFQADGRVGQLQSAPHFTPQPQSWVSTSPKTNSPNMFSPPTEIMKTSVEKSWELVQSVGSDIVAERLYQHFFAMVPNAMELFPSEVLQKYRDWTADEGSCEEALDSAAMRKLWGKVLNAVGCSVAGLHNINRLVPMLRQLGSRHINYGPTEQYWDIAGKALNRTLRDFLGDGFTPQVEQAWSMTFSFIAAVMISGLREAQAAAQRERTAFVACQSQDASSVRSGASRVPSVSEVSHEDTWQALPSLQHKDVNADGCPVLEDANAKRQAAAVTE